MPPRVQRTIRMTGTCEQCGQHAILYRIYHMPSNMESWVCGMHGAKPEHRGMFD